MKLNSNALFLITSIASSLLLSSCRKESDDLQENKLEISKSLSSSEKVRLSNSFAKTLAIAMKNEPLLKKFLKEESLNLADGDYDIIYHFKKDAVIDGKRTLSDIIRQYAVSQEDINLIESSFLNLNIKIPDVMHTYAEFWDTNYSPSVVLNNSDNSRLEYNGYDSTGSAISMIKKVYPTNITLVIEESERVQIKSESSAQLDFYNSLMQLNVKTPLTATRMFRPSDITRTSYVTEPTWYNQENARNHPEAQGKKNVIDQIYIPKATYDLINEGFAEGALEIYGKVLAVTGDSNLFTQYTIGGDVPAFCCRGRGPRREAAREAATTAYTCPAGFIVDNSCAYDQWRTFGSLGGSSLRDWDLTLYGDRIAIKWFEADPGGKEYSEEYSNSSNFEFGIKTVNKEGKETGFNANFKGMASAKTTVKWIDSDDILYDTEILYKSKLGMYNDISTNRVKFRIHLQ